MCWPPSRAGVKRTYREEMPRFEEIDEGTKRSQVCHSHPLAQQPSLLHFTSTASPDRAPPSNRLNVQRTHAR